MLAGLQKTGGKTIIMVGRNVRPDLGFAAIGCVLVSGGIAMAALGDAPLADPAVGRLFLGG